MALHRLQAEIYLGVGVFLELFFEILILDFFIFSFGLPAMLASSCFSLLFISSGFFSSIAIPRSFIINEGTTKLEMKYMERSRALKREKSYVSILQT